MTPNESFSRRPSASLGPRLNSIVRQHENRHICRHCGSAIDSTRFWRFSADYLLAARAVDENRRRPTLLLSALQLYAISIELGLKSVSSQARANAHRGEGLSHNLSKALAVARRHKLGRSVRLDRREIAAIQILDITYSTHRYALHRYGRDEGPPAHIHSRGRPRALVLGLERLCTGHKWKAGTCGLTTRSKGPWASVGRSVSGHSHRGRSLNSIVRRHERGHSNDPRLLPMWTDQV